MWSIAYFATSLLLGVGLAMDAFSVSMANGMNEPKMSVSKRIKIAGTFAFFQSAMPLIGWGCVHTIAEAFKAFQKVIPWIALVLLCFIGGKMLIEGIKGNGSDEEESVAGLRKRDLFIQAIATSIDALSVGFTIANYGVLMAVVCALIIGAVTFVICMFGLVIGRALGTKLSGKASILGGIILIGIGVEIFVKGVIL